MTFILTTIQNSAKIPHYFKLFPTFQNSKFYSLSFYVPISMNDKQSTLRFNIFKWETTLNDTDTHNFSDFADEIFNDSCFQKNKA